MIEATDIRTIAVIGTGAIGASWTALALARGFEVIAADPAPGAGQALRDTVAIRLAEFSDPGRGDPDRGAHARGDRLSFTGDSREAAAAADLVLENGPERLEVKREIFAALDQAARPDVLLASSSSGLPPSSFQDACARHPERVLVAHPFNPPHLVPLVEIVGGRQTSQEAVQSALEVFRHLGKRPIRIRGERPGHVANRLQAALWREAYYLVGEGVVSVQDIDTAISAGPGLRWALLGPFATQHLSGGGGGLEHVLAHLGPPMVDWWHDLGAPELTPELVAALVAGVREELAGEDENDLMARRDLALRELMATKARLGLD